MKFATYLVAGMSTCLQFTLLLSLHTSNYCEHRKLTSSSGWTLCLWILAWLDLYCKKVQLLLWLTLHSYYKKVLHKAMQLGMQHQQLPRTAVCNHVLHYRYVLSTTACTPWHTQQQYTVIYTTEVEWFQWHILVFDTLHISSVCLPVCVVCNLHHRTLRYQLKKLQ
jgi:hypothetical protein